MAVPVGRLRNLMSLFSPSFAVREVLRCLLCSWLVSLIRLIPTAFGAVGGNFCPGRSLVVSLTAAESKKEKAERREEKNANEE